MLLQNITQPNSSKCIFHFSSLDDVTLSNLMLRIMIMMVYITMPIDNLNHLSISSCLNIHIHPILITDKMMYDVNSFMMNCNFHLYICLVYELWLVV